MVLSLCFPLLKAKVNSGFRTHNVAVFVHTNTEISLFQVDELSPNTCVYFVAKSAIENEFLHIDGSLTNRNLYAN